MKFLMTWELYEGQLHDTLAHFAKLTAEQDEALRGEDIKLLGRWHDLVRGTGAAIFETDNAEALTAYALKWNAHMDLDVSVVVDDEEARALGRALDNG